jgi:hypothetical protein
MRTSFLRATDADPIPGCARAQFSPLARRNSIQSPARRAVDHFWRLYVSETLGKCGEG